MANLSIDKDKAQRLVALILREKEMSPAINSPILQSNSRVFSWMPMKIWLTSYGTLFGDVSLGRPSP